MAKMTTSRGLSRLVGRTIEKIDKTDTYIKFFTKDGAMFKLYHHKDCCEDVYIDDICGNLDDLIGVPIRKAREDKNDQCYIDPNNQFKGTYTWTFYNFATSKGYVTIKFYGTSNGNYSEKISVEITDKNGNSQNYWE